MGTLMTFYKAINFELTGFDELRKLSHL